MLSNTVSVSEVGYWRLADLSANPPLPIFIDGRATQGIQFVAICTEAVGDVMLAVGILTLARLCRGSDRVPEWLTSSGTPGSQRSRPTHPATSCPRTRS